MARRMMYVFVLMVVATAGNSGCSRSAAGMSSGKHFVGVTTLKIYVDDDVDPELANDLYQLDLIVIIDGAKHERWTGSAGRDKPLTRELSLGSGPHQITVEVVGETACTFAVDPSQDVWVDLFFYWGRYDWQRRKYDRPRPTLSYTVSNFDQHPF